MDERIIISFVLILQLNMALIGFNDLDKGWYGSYFELNNYTQTLMLCTIVTKKGCTNPCCYIYAPCCMLYVDAHGVML